MKIVSFYINKDGIYDSKPVIIYENTSYEKKYENCYKVLNNDLFK